MRCHGKPQGNGLKSHTFSIYRHETGMPYYEHTQKVPDKAMVAASIAGAALGFAPPGILAKLLTWGFFASVAATFHSLTVEVDAQEVRIRFGKGLIRKSFPLAQIRSVRAVRTTPLQGWGIHWIGAGWLYNIYGLDAVELSFHNRKHAFIGTDEPQKLVAAILQRLETLE